MGPLTVASVRREAGFSLPSGTSRFMLGICVTTLLLGGIVDDELLHILLYEVTSVIRA